MCNPPKQTAQNAFLVTALSLISSFTLSLIPITKSLGQCLPPPSQVVETQVSVSGRSATIGSDGCSNFAVAWVEDDVNPNNLADVLIAQYANDGTAIIPPQVASANHPVSAQVSHTHPSIALTPIGEARLVWLGQCDDCHPSTRPLVLHQDFLFGSLPVPVNVPVGQAFFNILHANPSAGKADSGTGRIAWSDFTFCDIVKGTSPLGLVHGPDRNAPVTIRLCNCESPPNQIICRPEWMPCMAVRSIDGYSAIAFAYDELPGEVFSPFNIALQVFDPNGVLVAQRSGPDTQNPSQWVNNPSVELLDSSQLSPAVSFMGEDIVVTWVGPLLVGCTPRTRIFARRFKFDPMAPQGQKLRDPGPGEGRAGILTIDSDPNTIFTITTAHPTVALADENAPNVGEFIVAWNTTALSTGFQEIHAQYVTDKGTARGPEFRVNQGNGQDDIARLAESGQHTLAYGADDQVVISWTQGMNPSGVFFTLLPPGFADSLGTACCKADVNGNGLRDGLDIQPFVDLLLNPPPADPCQSIVEQYLLICPADMDSDGDVDLDDVPLFVTELLTTTPCAMGGFNPGAGADCNGNGRPDATDVFFGTSQDCNLNGVPDECDISSQSSGDVNDNGIPDECEADCNGNGVPDDKDIADGTSIDVNSNGVPDECDADCNGNGIPDDWDISQGTSADCNSDGVPDDCEEDCNGNGVPDDCDIDPTDPDGDGLVSADCNGNNWPDECDLAVPPPFGSLDCNNNGLPDECDIAGCLGDPACGDCNGNGVPDVCDISSGISADTDANGIPDECESQQAQGGGSGGAATLEAYTAFYDWCFAQQWGPHAGCTCSEQFQGMVNMEQQLGLPLGDPKYMPAPQE